MFKLTKEEERKSEIWMGIGLVALLAFSHTHNVILNFIGQ